MNWRSSVDNKTEQQSNQLINRFSNAPSNLGCKSTSNFNSLHNSVMKPQARSQDKLPEREMASQVPSVYNRFNLKQEINETFKLFKNLESVINNNKQLK
jgi:hypothetical protein